MNSVCDRNCFECPYLDCICDELTLEDYQAEREIDLLSGARILKTSPKVAAQQKQYREANKEKVAAQQKQWYEANKKRKKDAE